MAVVGEVVDRVWRRTAQSVRKLGEERVGGEEEEEEMEGVNWG